MSGSAGRRRLGGARPGSADSATATAERDHPALEVELHRPGGDEVAAEHTVGPEPRPVHHREVDVVEARAAELEGPASAEVDRRLILPRGIILVRNGLRADIRFVPNPFTAQG